MHYDEKFPSFANHFPLDESNINTHHAQSQKGKERNR